MIKKKKKLFFLKREYLFLLIIPVIAISLLIGFRKTISQTSLNAQLEVEKNKNKELVEENNNWRNLYFEVYNIKEDYRKTAQDLSNLVFLKNMPIGGQSDLPPIKATDKLTIKMMQDTISSFKEVQDSMHSFKNFLVTRKTMIDDVPFSYPLKTDGTVKISSGYGFREDPFTKKLNFHPGVDLVADIGDPVIATANGTVKYIDLDNKIYGMLVVVQHSFGFETWYAHLSEIDVKIGQKIKRSDVVGKVGITGETTGPHLHYEIHSGNETTDPMELISATP